MNRNELLVMRKTIDRVLSQLDVRAAGDIRTLRRVQTNRNAAISEAERYCSTV